MKVYFRLLPTIFCIAVLMISIPGCEYDVAEPQWYLPHPDVGVASITSVDPPSAVPGVNFITINGENFAVPPAKNYVYFDNLIIDIVEVSATSITVRRPNMVSDSCIIKVCPEEGSLTVAKYNQPYNIDAVIEKYGTFIENVFLSAVAVDANENIYVSSVDSNSIFVANASGKTLLTKKIVSCPADIAVDPSGNLVMTGSSGTNANRTVQYCNTQTGVTDTLIRLAKAVKFCDFDANGYLYAVGSKSDIYVIAPDSTVTTAGLHASDDVLAMCIGGGYLYAVTKVGTGTAAVTNIVKHAIGANGTLSAAEPVLDWNAQTTEFDTLVIHAISVVADGKLFIGVDSPNPLLVYDPGTGIIDYFYKGIVPGYIRSMCWGNGEFLYEVHGHPTYATDWTVYRIDMGSPEAL